MDPNRADEIARVMLEPDAEAREARDRKRALEERSERRGRTVAGFVLVGFAVGAIVSGPVGVRFTEGGLWGGIVASVLGWIWVSWRERRGATAAETRP
jgi:uncharacterized membrane protein YoaK (UPF0700 family)